MNRRGFLKAAAAAIPTGAIPAASVAPTGVLAGGLGLGAVGGAANVLCIPEGAIPMSAAAATMWAALDDIQEKERVRVSWWAEYRRHRIAVRRGREQPMPANLVWLRKKLKDMRREYHISRRGEGLPVPERGYGNVQLPHRFHYRLREQRERRAMRARGFLRMPWEVTH